MVYKKGPRFRVRPVPEILADLNQAKLHYGDGIRTLFLPAGNTIAMPTEDLCQVCAHARSLFPRLERITVYGSSGYIFLKGPADLAQLKNAGLTRIHVGLESGDNETLSRIKKGTDSAEQIQAGIWVKEAGIQLSEYVILGIGGKERTEAHARETARTLNAINPDYIRFRTFLPKVNTLLLHRIRKGRFQMLTPHEVIRETMDIIQRLQVTSRIASDHYTNFVNIHGKMPDERANMLFALQEALLREESSFRPFYVGTQ